MHARNSAGFSKHGVFVVSDHARRMKKDDLGDSDAIEDLSEVELIVVTAWRHRG